MTHQLNWSYLAWKYCFKNELFKIMSGLVGQYFKFVLLKIFSYFTINTQISKLCVFIINIYRMTLDIMFTCIKHNLCFWWRPAICALWTKLSTEFIFLRLNVISIIEKWEIHLMICWMSRGTMSCFYTRVQKITTVTYCCAYLWFLPTAEGAGTLYLIN